MRTLQIDALPISLLRRLPSARSPREGRVVGGVAEAAVSTPTPEIDDGEHSFAFDAKGQKSRENAS
jgi:hypothetical protein